MNNNKLISELLWIQESIICRMVTDAKQSLSRVILALQRDNIANKELLVEQLQKCAHVLYKHESLRAAALLATIIDQEMTAYIKWRARHPTPQPIEIKANNLTHPALSRINSLLFDNQHETPHVSPLPIQALTNSPEQENVPLQRHY